MNKKCFLPILAAVSLLTGCTSEALFDYNEAPGIMARVQEAGAGRKTVAVMPFLDQRGAAGQQSTADWGSFYWGLVPLMPFGFVVKPEPEKSYDFVSLGYFHFDAQNDLSNAAFLSLKESNLFDSVVKANNLQQAGNADYLWRGKVLNTEYRGYHYTYFITYFFAPVLWVAGFPYGHSRNELYLRFELVERASGNVVWSYDYAGTDFIFHWIYARIGQDTTLYARLMKQAMNGAIVDLSGKLPQIEK